MRRAWIEIVKSVLPSLALPSPSMRRAWIEIPSGFTRLNFRFVALHAEGVD